MMRQQVLGRPSYNKKTPVKVNRKKYDSETIVQNIFKEYSI